MNKNVITGIVIAVVIVLGLWFYFKSPAPINAPVNTNALEDMNMDDMQPTTTPTQSGQNPGTTVDLSLSANTGTVKSFNVTGSNFKFDPSEIRVKKGDTVKITLASSGMHDFRIDEFNVKTNVLKTGDAPQTVQFVADKTGTFEYYCSVGNHRAMGMVGKLIVE